MAKLHWAQAQRAISEFPTTEAAKSSRLWPPDFCALRVWVSESGYPMPHSINPSILGVGTWHRTKMHGEKENASLESLMLIQGDPLRSSQDPCVTVLFKDLFNWPRNTERRSKIQLVQAPLLPRWIPLLRPSRTCECHVTDGRGDMISMDILDSHRKIFEANLAVPFRFRFLQISVKTLLDVTIATFAAANIGAVPC